MGNQGTKPTTNVAGPQAEAAEAQHNKLFSSTFKTVTRNGERELTSDLLESTLFPGFSELSSLIIKSLQCRQNGTTPTGQPGGRLVTPPHGDNKTTADKQTGIEGNTSDVQINTTNTNITDRTFVDFASEWNQKQLFHEYCDLYFGLFASGKPGLNEEGCRDLVHSCCKSGLVLCGCPLTDELGNQSVSSAVHSIFSLANDDGVIHKDQLQAWIYKHCPRLLDPLHTLVCQRLKSHDLQQASATSQNEMYEELLSNKYRLSVGSLYLLSCQLSPSYFPSSTSSHLSLNSVLHCGWQILYDSNAQGLSINRFQHHVFQYKGPTVALIAFEGHLYCLCITDEWNEHSKFWGGPECSLIQIEPHFKLIQNSADLVFLNWTQRSLPKGVQMGNQGRSRVLEVDGEFTSVKHYGIELPLHRIEVWGCGGEAALSEHQKQRAWEKKDTQKHKDRKLKIDDWEDSPDRQLLEWGGVKTRHNERM